MCSSDRVMYSECGLVQPFLFRIVNHVRVECAFLVCLPWGKTPTPNFVSGSALSQFTSRLRCRQSQKLHTMDFLNFRDVSFLPDSSIGRLCEDLNSIVGQGVWYDIFQVKYTMWFCFVNDIVTTMNNEICYVVDLVCTRVMRLVF